MKRMNLNLDFLGGAASLLCALHCMLLPAALAAGMLGGMAWLGGHWGERAFIGLSLILVLSSLVPSYLRKHGSPGPLLIAAGGFLLLLISQAGEGHRHYLAAMGGLAVAGAHLLNWRLLRREAKSCPAPPAIQANYLKVFAFILLLANLFLWKMSASSPPLDRGELLEAVWSNQNR
jgi:hypothetical protein